MLVKRSEPSMRNSKSTVQKVTVFPKVGKAESQMVRHLGNEALISGQRSCITWVAPILMLGKQFVSTWKGAEVAAAAERLQIVCIWAGKPLSRLNSGIPTDQVKAPSWPPRLVLLFIAQELLNTGLPPSGFKVRFDKNYQVHTSALTSLSFSRTTCVHLLD